MPSLLYERKIYLNVAFLIKCSKASFIVEEEQYLERKYGGKPVTPCGVKGMYVAIVLRM